MAAEDARVGAAPQYQAYSYDWLGNTTATDDDAGGFYDRSLGDIQLPSASQMATAMERVTLAEETEHARVMIETERLRSTLLNEAGVGYRLKDVERDTAPDDPGKPLKRDRQP